MEPGLRILAAACVLGGGVALAMMFRNDVPRDGSPTAAAGQGLLLRKSMEPDRDSRTPFRRSGRRLELPDASTSKSRDSSQAATMLRPVDGFDPPPVLRRDYPDPGPPARWGLPLGLDPLGAAGRPGARRIHKIVDGDTLESLAQRYLGSKERRLEIYEANRDVLDNPEVLPIGAKLKIPAAEASDGRPKTPFGTREPPVHRKDDSSAAGAVGLSLLPPPESSLWTVRVDGTMRTGPCASPPSPAIDHPPKESQRCPARRPVAVRS
jgi:phage tail protein X